MERMMVDGDETTAMAPGRLILCGWCNQPTDPDENCQHCGHEDPGRPWEQRGQEPPKPRGEHAVGRPPRDPERIRRRIKEGREALGNPTNAELADHLEISERTLGRWLKAV